MLIEVFIQNEAGSNLKKYHKEKTLKYEFARLVSHAYPYPYGFVMATTASDGLNVDCFVVTETSLKTGQIVKCEPIGLMEQVEDGHEDHNVLARLVSDPAGITTDTEAILVDFVQNVFKHIEGKRVRVGRFLPAADAETHIKRHLDLL